MLLFSWMGLVDVVRAEFLRARNFEYVKAARALGLENRHIMFRHILPNAMVATLTFLPFILTGAITGLTSLDFLGDRKSTRLNSSHVRISYAVFCLKKKKKKNRKRILLY